MTLLGGLLNKRSKKNATGGSSSASFASSSATNSSPEAEYVVTPDGQNYPRRPNGHNVYANPDAPMSSQNIFKMPFMRRQTSPTKKIQSRSTLSLLDPSPSPLRPPVASWASSVNAAGSDTNVSDSGKSHKRKPLFSLSSRSLPHEQLEKEHVEPDSPPPPPVPRKSPQKNGFLWNRERKQSTPTAPPILPTPDFDSPSTESFNLKSFRHITRSTSPGPGAFTPPPSNPSFSNSRSSSPALGSSPALSAPIARPRPRGQSNASDTSQRISVAAFREAQARRSQAGSPAPSLRPPSAADTVTLHPRSPGGAASSTDAWRLSNVRRSTVPVTNADGSTSSESSSEEESDSEDNLPLCRRRTITQRQMSVPNLPGSTSMDKQKSRSEAGHGISLSAPLGRKKSNRSHGDLTLPPRASTSMSTYTKSKASVSTGSFHTPSTAKRTSLDSPLNMRTGRPDLATTAAQKNVHDDSDTDDSEDNAPLAMLVNPARPGSNQSTRSLQPAKPLVDIKSIMEQKDRQAFTRHHTNTLLEPLVEAVDPPPRFSSLNVMAKSKTEDQDDLTSRPELAHRRASSDGQPIARGFMHDHYDDDPSPAPSGGIRVVAEPPIAEPRATPSPRATHSRQMSTSDEEEKKLDDTTPIVPTPIHERPKPSGFSVMSRPAFSATKSSPGSSKATESLASPALQSGRRSVTLDVTPQMQADTSSRISENGTSRPRSSTLISFPSQSGRGVSSVPPPLKSALKQSPVVSPGSSPATSRSRLADAVHQRNPSASSLSSPVTAKPRASLSSVIPASPSPTTNNPPIKPWNGRRESPASSTGDSSSGRFPLTPQDGSEVGVGRRRSPSRPAGDRSGERGRDRAVTKERSDGPLTSEEQKRRERRRSEAKNAIELGLVVNGPAPVLSSDDEEEPLSNSRASNPRLSISMPVMPMGGFAPSMPSAAMWNGFQPQTPSMFPQPPPHMMADPNFMLAHQQAMAFAKQAYQMAVAQQAMAAANDEWERGSAVSGMTNMTGGGGGGYFAQPMAMPPMPPMPMSMMNMGMSPGMSGSWTPGGSMMYPGIARSVYAPTSTGGSDNGMGWGASSAYGDAFGPSTQAPNRSSAVFSGQQRPQQSSNKAPQREPTVSSSISRSGARTRTSTAPSSIPLPQQHARSKERRPAPPSSWKRQP